MNGFNFSEASDIKLGGSTITALYYGSNKLWQAHDYSQEYFTIESLDDNNTISWWLSDGNYGTNKTIEWSTDKTNWTSVTSHYTAPGRTITTLNTGDKIYLKGTNTQLANSSAYCNFTSTGNYNVYGNIMSLLYGNNFTDKIAFSNSANYIFYSIFRASKVVDASNLILPATTLADSCYRNMFYNCTSLTTAPELPATTLTSSCYYFMFHGCTSLTTAPELPATTLTSSCYGSMFRGCTSLTTAPELPATTLTSSCYGSMFRGCTSLTTAPELPATTLANYCYSYMFNGCTSLSYIKCLATDISASSSLSNWVQNVASTGTFVKPTSMTSLPSGASGIPRGWTVVNV